MKQFQVGDRVQDTGGPNGGFGKVIGVIHRDPQYIIQWDDGHSGPISGQYLRTATKSLKMKGKGKAMAKFKVGDRVYDSFDKPSTIVEVLPVGRSGRQGYRIKVDGGSGTPSEWEGDLRSAGLDSLPKYPGKSTDSAPSEASKTPYHKGMVAQQQGKKLADNPYSKGLETKPHEFQEWEKGYLEAGRKGWSPKYLKVIKNPGGWMIVDEKGQEVAGPFTSKQEADTELQAEGPTFEHAYYDF